MFQILGLVMFIFFLTGVVAPALRMEECPTKDIMCKDIQNPAGYMFLLEPNEHSPVLSVEITQNGTPIAYCDNGRNVTSSPEVVQCDTKSITTRSCSELEVKFIHDDKEGKISESCLIFNTTEDTYKYTRSSAGPDWRTIAGIVVGVVVGVVVVVCFLRSNLGRGKGNPDSPEDQSAEENQSNCLEEQRQFLEGKGGNKESESGTTDDSTNVNPDKTIINNNIPQVNGVLPQKGLNGNMGHDPGGGKDTEQDCNRNLQNCGPRTLDKQRCNNRKENGCRSSCNQRSAREEAFDETAGDEGQALVDSSGPGNECTAPPHGGKDTQDKEGIMLNNISKY